MPQFICIVHKHMYNSIAVQYIYEIYELCFNGEVTWWQYLFNALFIWSTLMIVNLEYNTSKQFTLAQGF